MATNRLECIGFKRAHGEVLLAESDYTYAQSSLHASAMSLDACVASSLAWTVLKDAHPIFAFGAYMPWPGYGRVWAIGSPRTREHILPLIRVCRKLIAHTMPYYGIDRLDATVSINEIQWCRLAKLVGFKYESTMPRYGPSGEAHYVYSIVR